MERITIADLRASNLRYFSKDNKRVFGDVDYRILHDKQRQPYLVRSSYAFSDMFGNERTLGWYVNPISPTLEIMPGLDQVFATLDQVKYTLAEIT